MATKLQIRRGTAVDWGNSSEILADGELIWDTTNKQFKVGDGTKKWSELFYVGTTTTGAPNLDATNTFNYTNTFNAGIVAKITNSTKGIVIKAPTAGGTGANAFEVQDQDGLPTFLMDYTGVIRSKYSDRPSLRVADCGVESKTIVITGASYANNLITFTTSNSSGLTDGVKITFSGLPNTFAFLNGQTKIMLYDGSGTSSFKISYTPLTAPITAATNTNGSTAYYSCENSFQSGNKITITNLTDTAYNVTAASIVTLTSTSFFVNGLSISGHASIPLSGDPLENGVATQAFSSEINLINVTGTISGQTVPIQIWGSSVGQEHSGVDSLGIIYSEKFYTKTGQSLTSTQGGLGFSGSLADFIGGSIGVYDIANKNEIFGYTTIGYSTGGTSVGTQNGVLQVYKGTTYANNAGSALAVRAGSGTSGWLQTWMVGNGEVAHLDGTGTLSLDGGITAGGSVTTTGSMTASGLSTTGNINTSAGTISTKGTQLKRIKNGTYTVTVAASGVWSIVYTFTSNGWSPTSLSLIAVDSTKHIVCTLTEVPSLVSDGGSQGGGSVTVKFRAYEIGVGPITGTSFTVNWTAFE